MAGELEPGAVVGAYRVDSFVGRGGMGVVYAAEHVTLGRRVALKVVAPELVSDPAFRDRFLREARLAASLDHPNIIPVFDAGQDGDVLFLAMRFVEGENLGAVLEREHQVHPTRALKILGKIASALDEAHRNGLVHRDVKPDNILLAWGEEAIYLTDFGLVRRLDSRTRLTKSGYMMGTLNYMAPEVLRGEDIDARTDVYSLTCVLFESVTGDPPFALPIEPAVISAHLMDPPPAPSASRPELPEALDAVIAKGMAKERTARFSSCGELIAAAAAALEGRALPDAPGATHPETVVVAAGGTDATPTTTDPSGTVAPTGPTTMPPPPDSGASDAGAGSDGGTGGSDDRSSKRIPLIVGAIVAALVLAGVLVVPGLIDDDDGSQPTGSTSTTTGSTGSTGGTGSTGSTGSTGGFPAGVEQVATVEGTPTFIDVDAGAVWVTVGEGTVVRIDKGGGGRKTEIPVGADPVRTTFTGDEFRGDGWVVNRGDGTVTRVPLPDGEGATAIEVGSEPFKAISPQNAGEVWVSVSGSGRVVRLDARTGARSDVDVGERPEDLSFNAGSLWVTNSGSDTVSRVNPQALAVVATIDVGDGPTSIQPGGDFLWVADTGSDTVSVIDPRSNAVVDTIAVGSEPGGVTNDDQQGIWVMNRGGSSVSRIDTASRAAEEFPVGGTPVSMTKTDGALWLVTSDGQLIRIEPTTGDQVSMVLGGVTPVSIDSDVGVLWIAGSEGEVLRVETDVLS